MAEFYAWPWPAYVLFTLLLALCVLAQAAAMALKFFSRKRLVMALPELCILALAVFCSLLYGQVINSYETGFIAPLGFGMLRIDIDAWMVVAALLLILARGVYVCLRCYRGIAARITSLSVKNAVDSLPSGVLFSQPDGFILLSNARMQRLMIETTGKVQRNGRDFYGQLSQSSRLSQLPSDICQLSDGTTWMFTRTELRIKKKTYIQLIATDITDCWELTARVQRQNDQLAQKSEELKATIANLHVLSHEQETQKAKIRAHDILGQRLSLLFHTVHTEQTPDHSLLRSLTHDLMDELKSGGAPSPVDALDSLRQAFGSLGVEIAREGELPKDCVKAHLFVDIIREGATNAVRHGFATRMLVQMEGARLKIANNGPPPPDKITEGGGLGNIRKKVEAQGGMLRVVTRPRFVLDVDLSGDES